MTSTEAGRAIVRPVHLLFLGVVLGASFWLVDALIDSKIFGGGPFLDTVLPAERVEIYMRSLACLLLLLFGVLSYGVSRRLVEHARREEALRRGTAALRKILGGLIPICGHCKKIRDEAGTWISVESYVTERSEARFSHGMCPDCVERHYGKTLSPDVE